MLKLDKEIKRMTASLQQTAEQHPSVDLSGLKREFLTPSSQVDMEDWISDAHVEHLQRLRESFAAELKTCSAQSLSDLRSRENMEYAFRIRFKDPKQEPIVCKMRQIPFHMKERVRQTLLDQVKAGIIRPSSSNWASPIRVVLKDNSVRITVDYKKLNKVIVVERYPIPSVTELYAILG
jgi:hypothetical protein